MMDCAKICDVLRGSDTEAIREAAYQAGEMGCEKAVPLLVELLKSQNLGIQDAADQALRKLPGAVTVRKVIPLLDSDEAPVRNLSMDILRQVGGQDAGALFDLLRNKDADLRIFAADILGSAGDERAVMPLCAVLLHDPEVNVRYQAAVSLGTLGSPEAASCLNQALNDEEWVKFSVIEALIKIRDESSINALVGVLGTGSELVDSMIVEALGEMGNARAVPMLLGNIDRATPALRHKIVKALVKLLGDRIDTDLSNEELAVLKVNLMDALGDEDPDVQDAAMAGLGHLGDAQSSLAIIRLARDLDFEKDADRLELAVSALNRIGFNESLAEVLQGPDWKAGVVTIRVLSAVGGPDAAALLQEVFWDKDRDMQRMIVSALGQLAGEESADFFLDLLRRHDDGHILKESLDFLGRKIRLERATEVILNFLDHPFDDVKEAALNAAIQLGGPAVEQKFEEWFTSPDPMRRLMAVYAFGNMDVNAHMAKLEMALQDEVPDVRKIALEAIGSVCMTAPDTLALLERCLRDEHSEVRMALMEVLKNCRHPQTLHFLLEALDDPDDWVKIRAIEALAERQDPAMFSRILPLLDSSNKLVGLKAIESLAAMGGDDAVRVLQNLLDHEDPEVRDVASEALARLELSMSEDA